MQGKSQILDRVEGSGKVNDQSRLCVRAEDEYFMLC